LRRGFTPHTVQIFYGESVSKPHELKQVERVEGNPPRCSGNRVRHHRATTKARICFTEKQFSTVEVIQKVDLEQAAIALTPQELPKSRHFLGDPALLLTRDEAGTVFKAARTARMNCQLPMPNNLPKHRTNQHTRGGYDRLNS